MLEDVKDGAHRRVVFATIAIALMTSIWAAPLALRAEPLSSFAPTLPAVSVVLDGVGIDASVDARIDRGTVVAPLEPFVRDLAERIEIRDDGDVVIVARGDRSIALRIGSNRARNGAVTEALPIAPYVLAGNTIIPLAAIARALGAIVTYDARSRVLLIDLPEAPIATLSPAPYEPPAPGSVPTFAPTSTPAPRPTVTGIPRPRRTPILIEPTVPR